MKIKLIPISALVAIAVVALAPGLVLAGDHCESMHKNMSAEQWQEFKKNHGWVFSDETGDMDKSAIHEKHSDKDIKHKAHDKSDNGLIGA